MEAKKKWYSSGGKRLIKRENSFLDAYGRPRAIAWLLAFSLALNAITPCAFAAEESAPALGGSGTDTLTEELLRELGENVPAEAEETEAPTGEDTLSSSEEASPSPTEDTSPSSSEEASPSPTEGVSPSPSEEASPLPTEEVSPSPSEEVSPSPSEGVSPSPSEEISPSPSEGISPSPSEEASPLPTDLPMMDGDIMPSPGLTDGLPLEPPLLAAAQPAAEEDLTQTLMLAAANGVDLSSYYVPLSHDNGTLSKEISTEPNNYDPATYTLSGKHPITINYSYQFTSTPQFFNPVYTDENGTKYIVIASKAQLEAIGTDQPVVGGYMTLHFERDLSLLNTTWTFTGAEVHEGDVSEAIHTSTSDVPGIERREHTVAGKGYTLDITVGVGATDMKYGQNENYLFVNDIDMAGAIWTPWDYSGSFIKGDVICGLLEEDGTITQTGEHRNPVIANLTVQELDENGKNIRGDSQKKTTRGAGFFGAVYSPSAVKDVNEDNGYKPPKWDLIGNILAGVVGLVVGLVETIGGLVTDLVGLIAGWTEVSTLLVQPVHIEGLTLRNVTINSDGVYETDNGYGATESHPMPVGGFAGQLSGEVTVEHCRVEELQSLAADQMVGGFTGKTLGATEYLLNGTTNGLNDLLQGLGGVLDSVLNFLLPLDDLVTNLIKKLGVNKLVPTKYKPVVVTDCSVAYAAGANVVAGENIPDDRSGLFAGGFVGRAEGTRLTDCHVTDLENISAAANVGGFAGRICNAQLVGLLQGLGVNLVNFPVRSEVENCSVSGGGNGLTVTSTLSDIVAGKEDALAYAGGFAGAVMASNVFLTENSDGTAISGVTNLRSVTAQGSYVGGFAGYAGVGDVAEALNLLGSLLDIDLDLKIGDDGKIDIPLGSGLTKLLDMVLGVNLNAGLLSLIGLSPSQLVGCSVEGVEDGYSVTSNAGNQVGGFVGFLHGGRIAEQQVEERYTRIQATDADGNPLYIGVNVVTEKKYIASLVKDRHVLTGGVYARTATEPTGETDENGNPVYTTKIILEDIHGNPITAETFTDATGKTVYNIYDNVYIDGEGKAHTLSTFRDDKWAPMQKADGETITYAEDLPGGDNLDNLAFPVYQQVTTPEGYVQFTYSYKGKRTVTGEDGTTKEEDAVLQTTLYRETTGVDKNGKPTYRYYTRNADGTYQEYTGVEEESLSVDALQVVTEDRIEHVGSGAVSTTYINNLRRVEGEDYVGGVVGQAKLCSATDLLSNLTVVQYERFEITNVKVNSGGGAYSVEARSGMAGGATGYAMGGEIKKVQLHGLIRVNAVTYAGGFAGEVIPGTVAGEDGKGLEVLGLVSVSNLLTVVDAVHTYVSDCSVEGITKGFTVEAKDPENANGAAAGFVAWSINSHFMSCDVRRLAAVIGDTYAGGFCGVADTGSIAGVMNKTFGGAGTQGGLVDLSKLLGLNKLLSLLDVFPNQFTGCMVNMGSGQNAYTVRAVSHASNQDKTAHERINAQKSRKDPSQGSAGGFLGYGTAVQMDNCCNENLKSVDATSYAGGFGGYVEIGSVAQLGDAGLLGSIAKLAGVAALLDCSVSIIKSSHCQGTAGGYVITAHDRVKDRYGKWQDKGMAGGFIGDFEGSHIEGCYANHIDRVEGQEYAGGFIGRMVPGNVARVADGGNVLDKVLEIDGGLLGALQVMIPTVKNSYAKCVPCGGTITAYGEDDTEALSDGPKPIGMAGGYVGLNSGGQIWGKYDEVREKRVKNDAGEWVTVTIHTRKVENRAAMTGDYSGFSTGHEKAVYGTDQTCDILQLLLVDATKYAGGYSGFTTSADLAALGEISLLGGLIKLTDALKVGQLVVPTQKQTGVTGPLRNTTQAQMEYFAKRNEAYAKTHGGLEVDFSKYYGYTVGGNDPLAAGGYCGLITTGVVDNSVAFDLISSSAVQYSGGFVGAMTTGGVAGAEVDDSLLGGLLSGADDVIAGLLSVADVVVPVIKHSGVYGYYSGSRVMASNGSAGGYAGAIRGGQIWGDNEGTSAAVRADALVHTYEPWGNHCFTRNLRFVSAAGGMADAGGFVGYMGAASVADVGGLKLLNGLIQVPTNLVNVLSVTVPTVYYADTEAVDDWGFRVMAEKGRSAGGFAGCLQGAQVGVKEKLTGSIQPGESTGGEAGPAAPETPNVAGEQGNISVTGLRTVLGGDYAGGFFGYSDAADTLNVKGTDEAGENKNFTLLNLITIGSISALELAKSYVYNGSVTGIADGYRVSTANAYAWKSAEWDESKDKAACAGGFGGLLQSGVVRYCQGDALASVESGNYSGGFVGRMGKTSILKVDQVGTNGDNGLGILKELLKLGAGVGDVFGSHIEDSNISGLKKEGCRVLSTDGYHNIAGGFVGYADVCRLKNCATENLRLVQSQEIAGGFMGAMSDATLLDLDLGLLKGLLEGVELDLNLIKANRSKIENASVTGVKDWDGYDVYAGGADATHAATDPMGYAGAFIGLNTGSTITNGQSYYADTIKGTMNYTEPYVGTGENTALLGKLQLDVLIQLPQIKDSWSKSEIEESFCRSYCGDGATPGVPDGTYPGTVQMEGLLSPHAISANEADLMVRATLRKLTIRKELSYELGATPNAYDLDYSYIIQLLQNGTVVKTVALHPGESMTYDDLDEGTYTVHEIPSSVLPDNVRPAADQQVEVPHEGDAEISVVNTILPPTNQQDPDGGDPAYANDGKFIVNHIPLGDVEPEPIPNPCELLDEAEAEPVATVKGGEHSGIYTQTSPSQLPPREETGTKREDGADEDDDNSETSEEEN